MTNEGNLAEVSNGIPVIKQTAQGQTSQEWEIFKEAGNALNQLVLGQSNLVDRLLIALLADGHLLVEGAPGLAKTRAVKSLASVVQGSFHRIQFTPDLLPSDLTGTDIYQPTDGSFHFQRGPLFHNIVLADEINRAPAKVQSALLEAMAERQITVGKTSHVLPPLFLVMATQNPIEQEGTYPLPEAQMDRFLLHVKVNYPAAAVEREVLHLARKEALEILDNDQSPAQLSSFLTPEVVDIARKQVLSIHLSPSVEEYIVQLVLATRHPDSYHADLKGMIEYGASPRGTISLERAARANAWLAGRDYVSPDDVQSVVHDVLRHRIIVSFSAEAEGVNSDLCIDRLLTQVPVT
ncbi:MAG: MoxR family ATPase [Acidiferrobacterales bacterium]|nr:MoxR family ATPase [Acidiferrobacterales bacterium]